MVHNGTPTVLLVNPNTNRMTTVMMADLAQSYLAPSEIAVDGVTAAHGPSMILDPTTLAESAPHVVDAVRRRLAEPARERIVAVIVGAIGDPGRAELADALEVPVVGIGQASILAAMREGRRFGMATSTPLLADSLVGLVEEHGGSETFTGVRLTTSDPLLLAADPERQYDELAKAVMACAEQDGAQAVIIAGGPLSQTARRLADLSSVEIVEPLPNACSMVINALTGGVSSHLDEVPPVPVHFGRR